MDAVVVNFRRGRHRQKTNQLILQIKGSDDKKKAEKYVGKKVVFTSPAGKKINGEISSAHGNSGAVRARFERGLPGQILGRKVKVE
ncbi:MAG: 50S ribosomal protein L35Ae [Candidatus Woesearchaeota archaeon]|nr:50S ribosomal protein L35Ae [Candidatus Woesearchaeota archaeon]